MESLRRLARYNAWANERVFARCRTLDPASLGDAARGTIGTIESTLKHMTGVEDIYLTMLRGEQPANTAGEYEEYMRRDFAWFAGRSAELGDAYRELLDGNDESFLDGVLRVPWFKAVVSARDGLLQVFTHSAQHRAQVFSVLGERGLEVPDLDYIFMLEEAQSRPGG